MAPFKGYVKECDESVVWEAIPCPLCSGDKYKELIAVQRAGGSGFYRVLRCLNCGLGYLNPRPDPCSIGQLYPEEYECYHAPQQRPKNLWRISRERLEQLVQRFYLGDPPPLRAWHEKALARVVGLGFRPAGDSLLSLPFHGEGRLLDFGCGSGWYAYRMQKRGWTVTGMDFSAHAARHVSRRFEIPVLVGTLPHPELKPQTFDVITMGCVLEHIHWPNQVVSAAARALLPGGLLVISVPNIESWGFRRFGQDWWPLELPRHLLHFTPESLQRLVEMHGLEVREMRMLGRTSWMRRSLLFSQGRADSPLWKRLLAGLSRQRAIASLLTRWTVFTKQADCILIVARRPVEKDLSLHPAANAA